MHRSRALALGALACLALVLAPAPGGAQIKPPTMADRLAIAGELREGVAMARQVIVMLGSGLGSEGLKQADASSVKAYLMWNKAVAGVGHLEIRSKFPDPMLPHVTKIINEARQTISAAHTAIAGAASTEIGRSEQIARAIELLTQACHLAERAALLIAV